MNKQNYVEYGWYRLVLMTIMKTRDYSGLVELWMTKETPTGIPSLRDIKSLVCSV